MCPSIFEQIHTKVYSLTVDNGFKKEVILPKSENIILNLHEQTSFKKLQGNIEISKNRGSFRGNMYNPSSIENKQFLFGFFYDENDKTKMVFLKSIQKKKHNNLLYVLEKSKTSELYGQYLGRCGIISNEFSFNVISNPINFDSFVSIIGKIELHSIILSEKKAKTVQINILKN